MAIEAVIEINCSGYSDRIFDVLMLFDQIGWKYWGSDKKVEYLPLGDVDDYEWQEKCMNEKELEELINLKQDNMEKIGVNLYYQNSFEGLVFLADSTKEIFLNLCINRRIYEEDSYGSMTDIGWYIDNIIKKLKKVGCPIDYFKIEEYVG